MKNKQNKIKTENIIRVNTYEVIAQAVENGISYGYKRAFKHTEKPDEDSIKEAIYQAVMNDLSEILIFPDLYEK